LARVLVAAAFFIVLSAAAIALFAPTDAATEGPTPVRAGPVTFMNVSGECGLSAFSGNFFSWGDHDNDGYQDLLVDGKRLLRNNGPPGHTFTDVSSKAGLGYNVNSGVFADYDNDGHLDLFLGGGRGSNDHPEFPDRLLRNLGDGTFRDVTFQAGNLSDTFPTVAGAWSDIDRDGHLDLYMVNYENGTYEGYPDHVWFGTRDGTFENRTYDCGMDEWSHPYQGRGASFADFDNDGWQDLYVSNYRIMPNYLYSNDHGTMNEVAADRGVEGHASDHPVTREGPYYGHSVGSCWGDLDNDGDLDLWVTNLAHKDAWRGPICDDSYLFENLGEGSGWTFRDRRGDCGIPVKEIPGTLRDGDELFVSCSMADYDNDGDLDLFLPQIYNNISYAHSYLYRNDGSFRFTDVTEESGIMVWNTYGSAWGDYDGDGWMDLVTGGGYGEESANGVLGSSVHLYRNLGADSGTDNGFIKVELTGRESNRAAIGARATVLIDDDRDGEADRRMIREVQAGNAANGLQDSMVLDFGLGQTSGIVDLVIDWPMGRQVVYRDIGTDLTFEAFEPDDEISYAVQITDSSLSEGYVDLSWEVANPTDYPLKEYVLWTLVEGGSTSVNYGMKASEVLEGEPIGPGGSWMTSARLEGDGVGFEDGDRLTVMMLGAYPRPGSNPYDGLRLSKNGSRAPVAVLFGPDSGEVGAELSFTGIGSYSPEGRVVGYRFDFDDGTPPQWQDRHDARHAFDGPGSYSVRLKVRNEEGLESERDAILQVNISEMEDDGPKAVISSIEPQEPVEGQEVLFEGYGVPASGHRIDGYEWRSDIDGTLAKDRAFTTADLSRGDHMIRFRVHDTSGRWSPYVEQALTVSIPGPDDLWIAFDPGMDLVNVSGRVRIAGTCGPAGTVFEVQVRIDQGEWRNAWSVPDWWIEMDLEGLDPGSEHVLEARAGDGEGRFSDTIARELTVADVSVDDDVEDGRAKADPGEVIVWLAAATGAALLLGTALVLVLVEMKRDRKSSREAMILKVAGGDTVSAIELEDQEGIGR